MTRVTLALLLLLASASFSAAQSEPSGGATPQSPYDKIWKFTEWYENDDNRVVQKVLFSGRFQEDYASLDAEDGTLSEWNVRRLRVGPKITFFHTLTLHAEVELNPQ